MERLIKELKRLAHLYGDEKMSIGFNRKGMTVFFFGTGSEGRRMDPGGGKASTEGQILGRDIKGR